VTLKVSRRDPSTLLGMTALVTFASNRVRDELREKAKRELGTKFDIRQFHDVVLTNGALPLDVLEDLVNRWIKSKQS
jgi:hypothetical protein